MFHKKNWLQSILFFYNHHRAVKPRSLKCEPFLATLIHESQRCVTVNTRCECVHNIQAEVAHPICQSP